jgi:hypothetical protein
VVLNQDGPRSDPCTPAGDLSIASSWEAGRLIVLLPYAPERVAKIKSVIGRCWHRDEKYWTVPHTDGALARLLALLAGEPIEVDPSLRPVAIAEAKNLQAGDPNAKLLDRVRQAIRARHYSPSTEQAYVAWIRRFILFHRKRHPTEMGEPEVNQFLTHLAVHEHVAASTQNQALAASGSGSGSSRPRRIKWTVTRGCGTGIIYMNRSFRGPSRTLCGGRDWPSPLRVTPSATPLPHTCWKTATTF